MESLEEVFEDFDTESYFSDRENLEYDWGKPQGKEIFVEDTQKPKQEKKMLEKLFEGYDLNAAYPFEVVDKGEAVGEELS